MFWKRVIFCICLLVTAWGPVSVRATPRAREIRVGVEEYGPLVQEEGGADVIHPQLSAYVQRVGRRVAAASDRPDLPYAFVVLDNTDLNAWALPGGKIGIHLGLLMHLKSEAELASVLAHEIGHAAAGHEMSQVERGIVLGVVRAGISEIVQNFWIDRGTAVGKELIELKYCREDELEADALGIKYMTRAGYDAQGAVAVEKMYLDREGKDQERWYQRIFATHPPSKERLKALKGGAARYGHGGFVGKEEYDRMIAPLRATVPAYRALDSGRELIAKGEFKKALKAAERGLSIEPHEPHLYQLKAQALLHLGREREALSAINRALAINANYYAYYVERALIYERLGNARGAERDRDAAETLLPRGLFQPRLNS